MVLCLDSAHPRTLNKEVGIGVSFQLKLTLPGKENRQFLIASLDPTDRAVGLQEAGRSEMSNFSQGQGLFGRMRNRTRQGEGHGCPESTQGIARRRTEVRRTSDPED